MTSPPEYLALNQNLLNAAMCLPLSALCKIPGELTHKERKGDT